MSDKTKKNQLIVRQSQSTNPRLEALLQLLQDEHGLDAYTARHRLTGSGKALLGSGTLEKSGALAQLLREHGFDCWVVQQTEDISSPVRLRDLVINSGYVELIGRDRTIQLLRGSKIVAILADLSGQLEERCLRRHMVQRNYKDAKHVTVSTLDEMIQLVLKGKPVLDLYLIDDRGHPQGAVRVFPGRFNAKGLGDRMTMSATRNIEAVLQISREYAGRFSLHADFGLGRLPDCQIKNLDGRFLDIDQILKRLTNFGWLMCDLEQDSREEKAEDIDPTLAAVAIASGRPALTAAIASGNLEAVPGLGEIVREIKEPTAESNEAEEDIPTEKWLPLPPDRPNKQISGRMVLSGVGSFLLAGFLVLIGQGNTSLLRAVVEYGVKAGVVPGLISIALLWTGFHFVRLKRKIENTPTSRIRSMAMGLVEIHGTTVRKYALVSPVSQSPCTYYRLRKYKKDNRNQWTLTSDKDSSHVPFLVDDGTGKVTVDPRGAMVRAKTSRTGAPGEMTLAFHGVSDDHDEKWVEEIIYEGTSLYVLGYAQPLREKRRSLRERTVEKLRGLKLDRKALHRYDADGDGQISEDEWQMARSDAEQSALKEHLSEGGGGKRQEEHAIIARPPQKGLPFVIAETATEERLVRKYWIISIPLCLFGLIAAGIALYFFFRFIGV